MDSLNTQTIITIDGPAASGKTSIGLALANALNYLFFDTGLMYRAMTYAALQRFGGVSDESQVSQFAQQVNMDVCQPSIADGRSADVLVDGKDVTKQLRTAEVEDYVSVVSAYPQVRKAMTDRQRTIGLRGRVVMVGRDIGTVVLPEARYKIYLDASVEERARRRYTEEQSKSGTLSYQQVLEKMRLRDQRDSSRDTAPLKPAADASVLITDGMNEAQVLKEVMRIIQANV